MDDVIIAYLIRVILVYRNKDRVKLDKLIFQMTPGVR